MNNERLCDHTLFMRSILVRKRGSKVVTGLNDAVYHRKKKYNFELFCAKVRGLFAPRDQDSFHREKRKTHCQPFRPFSFGLLRRGLPHSVHQGAGGGESLWIWCTTRSLSWHQKVEGLLSFACHFCCIFAVVTPKRLAAHDVSWKKSYPSTDLLCRQTGCCEREGLCQTSFQISVPNLIRVWSIYSREIFKEELQCRCDLVFMSVADSVCLNHWCCRVQHWQISHTLPLIEWGFGVKKYACSCQFVTQNWFFFVTNSTRGRANNSCRTWNSFVRNGHILDIS